MDMLPNPLHPAVIHFPIALSLVAVLFELLARHPRFRGLETPAALLIGLAALGGIAAVLTGDLAHDEAVVPPAAAALIARHRQIGLFAMWMLAALAVVRLVTAWRGWFKGFVPWAYLLAVAAVAGLVGYNGHLGGQMVFRHGLGTDPIQRHAVPGTAVHRPPPSGADRRSHLLVSQA